MQKRKTNTKDLIKNSFSKLILEKGIDSVTVSDISRLSNINRGTFYLHYLDKYDLLSKLEDEGIDNFKQILMDGIDVSKINNAMSDNIFPYNSILNALYYAKSDFEFISALLSDDGDPKFLERFKNTLEELLQEISSKSNNLTFSMQGLPSDYAKEILLSSITSIIVLWIKKGCIENPEEIADIIFRAIKIPPSELLL